MDDTRILHAALFTPGIGHVWGLPLMVIGPPGSAKTAKIVQTTKAVALHTEILISSLRDPTDFMGMPYVTTISKKEDVVGVRYSPPDWALRAQKAGRACVFMDETNTAPPSVQAALLRVVHERCAGECQLGGGVRVLGARNSVEDAAGGYELAPPLANRFGHIHWEGPDVKAWSAYILSAGNGNEVQAITTAEDEENRVLGLWPNEYATGAGIITSFLRRKPSLLHQQPASGSPASSEAWPSRRTWEMAIRALASSKVQKLSEDEADRFVGSFVGAAAMRELRTWMAELDLPDPSELLDGKCKFVADKDRLDRTMVVLSSCAALVAPESAEKRPERAAACWKLVLQHMETADVCYPAVSTLSSKEVRLVDRQNPDSMKVLAKFHPILVASGAI